MRRYKHNLDTIDLQTELNDLYTELEDVITQLIEEGLVEDQAVDVWDKEYTENMLQHLYDDCVDHNLVVEVAGITEKIDEILELRSDMGDDAWYACTVLYKDGCEKEIGIDFVSEYIGDVDMIRSHIDFEAIGEEVLRDYTSVEFRGETYYYQE